MTINQVINIKPDKTILVNFGNLVIQDDTVGKISKTSNYAVFQVHNY